MGIFNKYFLSEALAVSSQPQTKHNAFALPAPQCQRHVWKSSQWQKFYFPAWQRALGPLTPAELCAGSGHTQLQQHLVKREKPPPLSKPAPQPVLRGLRYGKVTAAGRKQHLANISKEKRPGLKARGIAGKQQKPKSDRSFCRTLIAAPLSHLKVQLCKSTDGNTKAL